MTAKTATNSVKSGDELWQEITSTYELRADERRVLSDACREVDLLNDLDAELRGSPLMVPGSMGQMIANPLINEIRQHRVVLARLLGQLKLPDDSPEAAGERSSAARAAAQARWSRRGA